MLQVLRAPNAGRLADGSYQVVEREGGICGDPDVDVIDFTDLGWIGADMDDRRVARNIGRLRRFEFHERAHPGEQDNITGYNDRMGRSVRTGVRRSITENSVARHRTAILEEDRGRQALCKLDQSGARRGTRKFASRDDRYRPCMRQYLSSECDRSGIGAPRRGNASSFDVWQRK